MVTVVSSDTVRRAGVLTNHTIRPEIAKANVVRQNTRAINIATTTTTAADVAGTVVTAVAAQAIWSNLNTVSNARVWTQRSSHPLALLKTTRVTASATMTITPRHATGTAVTAVKIRKTLQKNNSNIANSANVNRVSGC